MVARAVPAFPTQPIDWPPYWLVALERAVSQGDHATAADAQRQLRRLGLEASLRVIPHREPRPEAAHVG